MIAFPGTGLRAGYYAIRLSVDVSIMGMAALAIIVVLGLHFCLAVLVVDDGAQGSVQRDTEVSSVVVGVHQSLQLR